MRILLLTNIFPTEANPTGGTFISSRIDALRTRGIEVDAVAVGARPASRTDLRAVGYLDATVSASRVDRLVMRLRARSSRHEATTALQIQKLVDTRRPNGIMAHGAYSLSAVRVASQLAREFGIPMTAHLHGSDVNKVMPRNPRASAEVLNGATSCIFVSHALHHRAKQLGFHGENGVVTGNGVSTDVFSDEAMRHARPESSGGPHLAFVGNLQPIKGADRLPGIFQAVCVRHPGATMVVIGDGPLRKNLERRMSTPSVKFVGRLSHPEVAHEMACADALLLPSRSEGWPTVINESYAVGTPVVASDVGGSREALIHPDMAVPQGRHFASRFAERLDEILTLTEPAALRDHAREYSWDHIVSLELRALGVVS